MNLDRWMSSIIFSFGVFCRASVEAAPQEKKSAVGVPLQLNVGMMEYHPFLIPDDDGPKGLIIEYTQDMLASLELPLTFQTVPINRSVEQLRNQQLDIMLVLYKTPDREKSVLYAQEPLLHLGQGFCTAVPMELKPLHAGSRLAYVRGTVIPKALQGMTQFPVAGDRAQERMLQMLHKGRVDAVHSPMPGVLVLAAQHANIQVALHCYEIKNTRLPVYLGFSKGLPTALKRKLEIMQQKRIAKEDFDTFVKRRFMSQGFTYPPVTFIESSQLPQAPD
ncbi:substrate-binding periplasmic protein [Oligoflexus tunisiensis]|uniref:substrate-binding periplasmic protein n=1 Tax=Oligoflexus tunisiensis TaxID=708132 RepID=UPI00114CFD58|nr:transporter substrate-binding domain-containing protein [Oligoflexus tunisiensis]